MEDCLFCKFVKGEIPVNKVYEDEDFIIIRDINPQARNHFLKKKKKHFKYLAEMSADDEITLGRIMKKISSLKDELELGGGYRLVINQGDDAGQTVPHLHIHILSGQKMGWQPAYFKTRRTHPKGAPAALFLKLFFFVVGSAENAFDKSLRRVVTGLL